MKTPGWFNLVMRASQPVLVIVGIVVTIVLQCCQLSMTRKIESAHSDAQEMDQAIGMIDYLTSPDPKKSELAMELVRNLKNEKLGARIMSRVYTLNPDTSAKKKIIGILKAQHGSYPIEELNRLANSSSTPHERDQLIDARNQVVDRSRKTFMEDLRHAAAFYELGDLRDAAEKFRKISYLLAGSGNDSGKVKLGDAYYDLGNFEEAAKTYYGASQIVLNTKPIKEEK